MGTMRKNIEGGLDLPGNAIHVNQQLCHNWVDGMMAKSEKRRALDTFRVRP